MQENTSRQAQDKEMRKETAGGKVTLIVMSNFNMYPE